MKLHFKLFLVLVVFYCLSAVSSGLYAQTIKLADKISFSANNIPVSEALEALSRTTGTNFSYNPDQLPANRIVKVDMNNRPLSEVIGAILNSSDFGYRQMGNQIIIYKNKSLIEESEEPAVEEVLLEKQQQKSQNEKSVPIKYDTVYLTRNLHDTLILKDTIFKTDTVFEKVQTPVSVTDIFHVSLGQEFSPEFKFEAGLSLIYYFPHSSFSSSGEYINKLEQYKDSYSNNSFAGSIGIDIKANYKNLSVGSGIFLTLFSQKLDYSYLNQQGGFFRRDTLDPYFTIIDGDTTWYYIIDSSYVPVDNRLYNYKVNNHFNYLEIPLTFQYNLPLNNMLLFGKAGIITGIMTGYDGHQIIPDKEGIINTKDIKAKSFMLSYIISGGVAIPVSKKMTFYSSIQYRSHFGSIYKDFPIRTKFSALGISIGLNYKFY